MNEALFRQQNLYKKLLLRNIGNSTLKEDNLAIPEKRISDDKKKTTFEISNF